MRLTSLTPDMLTHITPRGISALPGPVGEPTLLAPVDEKNETYVFNPRYADAYYPEGYFGPARAGR